MMLAFARDGIGAGNQVPGVPGVARYLLTYLSILHGGVRRYIPHTLGCCNLAYLNRLKVISDATEKPSVHVV